MSSKLAKVSNAKFDVEKFDGKNNFGLWQVQVKDVLIQQGLHKALKGLAGKAADVTDSDWEDYDLQACSTIRLCLSKEIVHNFMHEKSAALIWSKLESQYMTKSLQGRLYLKKQLYAFRMIGGTVMQDHLNEFSRIVSELLNLDVILEDEDKALLLLSSLPDSYEHLVTTMLYGKDTVEYSDVTATLLSNELRKKVPGNESQAEGLVARGRTENRKSGQNRFRSKSRIRKDSKCHHCKQKGHWKADCPKLKDRTEEKAKSSDSASVAEESSDDGANVLSVTSLNKISSDGWILDSGCSYHMCPTRDSFMTYEAVNGGNVLMGNDVACKTVGIGTINIKMHDGIVRTLTKVRHVPDLKKNLISLGALDSLGCKIVAECGVLKVVRGAMVMMKGNKVGNLYFLAGNTVTGRAAVSTSGDSESTSTQLWHMRLGHMSERGLTELSKRGMLGGLKTAKLNFCEHCVFGKQCRVKFSTTICRTKGTLDYVHSNVWGPSQVASKGGSRYLFLL